MTVTTRLTRNRANLRLPCDLDEWQPNECVENLGLGCRTSLGPCRLPVTSGVGAPEHIGEWHGGRRAVGPSRSPAVLEASASGCASERRSGPSPSRRSAASRSRCRPPRRPPGTRAGHHRRRERPFRSDVSRALPRPCRPAPVFSEVSWARIVYVRCRCPAVPHATRAVAVVAELHARLRGEARGDPRAPAMPQPSVRPSRFIGADPGRAPGPPELPPSRARSTRASDAMRTECPAPRRLGLVDCAEPYRGRFELLGQLVHRRLGRVEPRAPRRASHVDRRADVALGASDVTGGRHAVMECGGLAQSSWWASSIDPVVDIVVLDETELALGRRAEPHALLCGAAR